MNCPHCGRDLDLVQGQKYCTFCGGNLEPAESTGEERPFDKPVIPGSYDSDLSETRDSRPDAYCPWEDQEALGFVQGIRQTLRGSLFQPYEFFAAIPVTGGLLQPLLYALIVETLGVMMGLLWMVFMNHPIVWETNAIVAVLIPVAIFFKIMVWAVILRLSLFLLGGATEDFEATFRAVCYTSGPELFNAIPFLGGFIALGWRLYITAVALRQVHRIGTGKAILAIVLPSILCLAVILVVTVIAFSVFKTGSF